MVDQYWPAIAIRKCDDVFFIVVDYRDHALPDHVDPDRQAQELGLRPYVAVQGDSLGLMLCIEGWYYKKIKEINEMHSD